MKHVEVNPGVCGFIADIKVELVDKRKVKLEVSTGCEMISNLISGLGETVKASAIMGTYRGVSILEQARRETPVHAACPVLVGIIKAVEAECQLALPRDASIKFIDD